MTDEDPEFDLKAWIDAQLTEMLDIQMDFEKHDIFFGVPCGPTLSMTDPTKAAYYMTRPEEKKVPESVETVNEYIILTVPPNSTLEQIKDDIDDIALRLVVGQFKTVIPRYVLLGEVDWILTSDWQDVERKQPDCGCATCKAGNDQAIAYLKQYPNRKLALGSVECTIGWGDAE